MEVQPGVGADDACQKTGMMTVLSHIDGSGFHGIDMALGAAATIDPAWQRSVRDFR
jgi:hypothetical protein